MAVYTQSIREILQQNMAQEQSLENVSDVYNIASAHIFDKIPSGVINDDYLQQFITGFTLHFMNEEIGYETLPLWKIALNEKIFNSGSYINAIYENLDKQIFADYRVKNARSIGSTSGSKTATGSATSSRDISTGETTNDTQNIEETTGSNTTDGYTSNDVTTMEKAGSETHSKGGNDSLVKAGAESTHKSGTDIQAKKGSELTVKGGSDTVVKSGSETTQEGGGDTTHRSTGSDNRVNGAQITSDTPMGSLSNLRNTSYDGALNENADGDFSIGGNNAGADLTLNNTYNYMSGAVEQGQTTLNAETSNERVDTDRNSTLSFDDRADETQYGGKQATTYGKDVNNDADARTDETTYGANEDIQYGVTHDGVASPRTDTTQYNSNEVVTYGKNGATIDKREDVTTVNVDNERSIEVTGSKEATNTNTGSRQVTTDDDTTQSTTDNETTSGSHTDTEDVTDYSLNWEMLYRSMPLLNKVWELFDDLFMLIF